MVDMPLSSMLRPDQTAFLSVRSDRGSLFVGLAFARLSKGERETRHLRRTTSDREVAQASISAPLGCRSGGTEVDHGPRA